MDDITVGKLMLIMMSPNKKDKITPNQGRITRVYAKVDKVVNQTNNKMLKGTLI